MTRRRSHSIAAGLYRRIVLLVALIGLAMAGTLFWAARNQIQRQADGELVTASNVLYALMEDELRARHGGGRVLSVDDSLLSSEDLRALRTSWDWRMFTVTSDGREVVRSDTAPPAAALPHRAGFVTVALPDGDWRVFGLAVPEGGLLIQVGERVAVRDRLISDVAGKLIVPLLLLIAGSAILLWLSLFDGLAHLRQFSAAVSRRGPQSTERFQLEDWPRDLSPLVTTLNQVLERVDAALQRERQFTDDAAHQLRTPLATLRLQIQALARMNDGRDREVFAPLLTTVDRATSLLSQMLTLARLDASVLQTQAWDVEAIAHECIADHAVAAAGGDVKLMFETDHGSPVIETDRTAISLALSNLLENAIKHAPAGSLVKVSLATQDPEQVVLSVTDHGRGIPKEVRRSVLQRFHRGHDDNAAGAGLGLAIVASAVAQLNGELELADAAPGRGLLARITIPR